LITDKNIKHLENLVKKYALLDFFRANPKPIRQYRNGQTNYNPYGLSTLTNDAREMLSLARNNPDRESEEKIKGYLFIKRMNNELVDDYKSFEKKMFKENWKI
jgi:hypothetical protein